MEFSIGRASSSQTRKDSRARKRSRKQTRLGRLRSCGNVVLTLSVSACFAGSVCAQGPSFTSPRGYLSKLGNGSGFATRLAAKLGVSTMQFAQIDASQRGRARASIKAVNFRQGRASPSATAGKMRFAMRIAHADFSKVVRGNEAFQTLRTSAWVEVVAPKLIDLPNWTSPAKSKPASWGLRVAFDKPWNYDGKDALLYHILAYDHATTGGGHLFDDVFVGAAASSRQELLGQGCATVGTMSLRGSHAVYADPKVLSSTVITASNVPSNSPAIYLVGLRDPKLQVPGLCTTLRSSAEIALPMLSNASGGASLLLRYAHSPAFVGKLDLFAQLVASDRNQSALPLALSNGLRTGAYPERPGVPNFAAGQVWTPTTKNYIGAGRLARGVAVIAGFEN